MAKFPVPAGLHQTIPCLPLSRAIEVDRRSLGPLSRDLTLIVGTPNFLTQLHLLSLTQVVCNAQNRESEPRLSTMIPTPDLSHLSPSDYDRVYEPSEDTFILLDALELDAVLLQRLKPRLCVEVG